RLLGGAVPVGGTFLTFYRYQPKTCWPTPHGAASVGAPARKESSRLVLPPSACGSPTDHHSASEARVSNICQGVRFGSSANTGCRERKNTISPIVRRRPACVLWRRPSRRGGSVSRLISSSKKNSGSITSRVDPGKAFTVMHS